MFIVLQFLIVMFDLLFIWLTVLPQSLLVLVFQIACLFVLFSPPCLSVVDRLGFVWRISECACVMNFN